MDTTYCSFLNNIYTYIEAVQESGWRSGRFSIHGPMAFGTLGWWMNRGKGISYRREQAIWYGTCGTLCTPHGTVLQRRSWHCFPGKGVGKDVVAFQRLLLCHGQALIRLGMGQNLEPTLLHLLHLLIRHCPTIPLSDCPAVASFRPGANRC